MKAIKVVKDLFKTKNVAIGIPVEIYIPPRIVLERGFAPIDLPEEIELGRFKVKGKVLEGIVVGDVEDDVDEFVRYHGVPETEPDLREMFVKRSGRRRKFPRRPLSVSGYDVHRHSYVPEEHKLLLQYSVKGETYLLKEASNPIFIFKWIEEKGKISPIICGRIPQKNGFRRKECLYLYYSGYKKGKSFFMNFVEDYERLPEKIRNNLNGEYGYGESGRYRLGREIIVEPFIDPLPFPPYEVVGALRLQKPEEVEKASEKKISKVLEDIFILKTFLLVEEPINVMEVSAGELKVFAKGIQGDIFDPKVTAEDFMEEYRRLWSSSSGFVLLCKPKWTI